MSIATHDDIVRIFPGIEDHTAVEILETRATVDELEAVRMVLTSDSKELVEIKQREGTEIHRLLSILDRAGIELPTDID